MVRCRRERFGFGIGVDGDFVDVSAVVSRINELGVPDDGLESYADLSDTPWRGLYWGSWDSVEESVRAAAYRAELATPLEPIDVDLYYSGKSYRETYGYTLQLPKFYDIVRAGGGSRPRVLVLGCGTGESLLDLEVHGFDAYGMEYGPEPFRKAGSLALSRMEPGDFMVDLARYGKDSFDYVITDRISLVHDFDLDPLAQDIRYICRGAFYAPYVKLPGCVPRNYGKVNKALRESGLRSLDTWLHDCSTESR